MPRLTTQARRVPLFAVLPLIALVANAQSPQWPPVQPGGAPPVQGPPVNYLPSPQTSPFMDAFGRFRVAVPQGTEQFNATYNFVVPNESLQINVSVAMRDQLFQNSLRSFPEAMRSSGASKVGEQQFDYRGRKATTVLVLMTDSQTGLAIESLNVFVPGPNIWLQVVGPAQSDKRIEAVMQELLNTLQTAA